MDFTLNFAWKWIINFSHKYSFLISAWTFSRWDTRSIQSCSNVFDIIQPCQQALAICEYCMGTMQLDYMGCYEWERRRPANLTRYTCFWFRVIGLVLAGTRSRKEQMCEAGPPDPLPCSIRNSLKKTPPSICSAAQCVKFSVPFHS